MFPPACDTRGLLRSVTQKDANKQKTGKHDELVSMESLMMGDAWAGWAD